MLGGRPMSEWIANYAKSHQHPVNRFCHTVGIPLVALSVLAGIATLFFLPLWPVFVALFVVGWIFQFVGHAFEGKKPEFLTDWRFLFVGLRWWFMKLGGKV
jgi:uncharacterized membrane protein YGL010W